MYNWRIGRETDAENKRENLEFSRLDKRYYITQKFASIII